MRWEHEAPSCRLCDSASEPSADSSASIAPPHSRFTGLEFVVAPSSRPQDDLFVIHKRQRASPTETTVVGAYYILNGNVYQAPSLFEVLNERVVRLRSSLLSESLPLMICARD